MQPFSSKNISKIALIGSVFFLQSCSLTPPKSMMNVQSGETFELKQAITIAPDTATQFIQFGQLTSRSGFSRVDQHCRIEVKKLSEQPQTLVPEKFTIQEVRIGEEQIASKQSSVMMAFADNGIQSDVQPMTLSALWHGSFASAGNDVQRVETMDTVSLYLTPTEKNPNILRLTCAGSLSDGSLSDAPRSYRPQRAQINQILGNFGHVSP